MDKDDLDMVVEFSQFANNNKLYICIYTIVHVIGLYICICIIIINNIVNSFYFMATDDKFI